jgi:hypothetical protein
MYFLISLTNEPDNELDTLAGIFGIFVPDILPCTDTHSFLKVAAGFTTRGQGMAERVIENVVPLQCELPLGHDSMHQAYANGGIIAW